MALEFLIVVDVLTVACTSIIALVCVNGHFSGRPVSCTSYYIGGKANSRIAATIMWIVYNLGHHSGVCKLVEVLECGVRYVRIY